MVLGMRRDRVHILCHNPCDRKQTLNFSSKLLCVWASMGLSLPEKRSGREGLQSHRPPF